MTAVVQRVILYYTFKRAGEKNMPAKKENRMRKEFEEKDIHQEVRLNKYLSEAGDAAEGRKWFCWRFTNQRA